HRVRPRFRQGLVGLHGSARVGVSAHLDLELRPLDEDLADLVQNGLVLRQNFRLAGAEVDVVDRDDALVEHLGLFLRDLDRAAVLVDPSAGRRIRAHVLVVRDTVTLGVLPPPLLLFRPLPASARSAGGGARPLALVVGPPAAVGSLRAPAGAHRHARRGIRALVDAVEHAVLVAVGRAATRVDRGTGRRVGALIDAVTDAVLVRVDRAAVLVDAATHRGVRTLVGLVLHAVLVRVLGAAEGQVDAAGDEEVAGG